MYCIEKVINTIIRLKHSCYFIIKILNSYWAIQIKLGDEYKTGFITLHSQ